MWRCHCGETNLNSRTRCAACDAARLTHESEAPEAAGRSGRPRTVQFGFFGMGLERGRGDDDDRGRNPPRILSESELGAYYARERRRDILNWIGGGLALLAVLGLLAWQIMRSAR